MSSLRDNALIIFDEIALAIRRSGIVTRFVRRNGYLLIGLAFLTIWTWATTAIAAHNARVDTTTELTEKYDSEYDAKVRAFVQQWEDDHADKQEPWVKDMEENEIPYLAKLANKLRALGLTDLAIETYLWSVPIRVDNAAYPSTVKAVLEQKSQYDLYDPSIKVTEEDKDLARKVLTTWHKGMYPNGFTIDHVYAVWTPGGDAYLRNAYETDSKTDYRRLKDESYS